MDFKTTGFEEITTRTMGGTQVYHVVEMASEGWVIVAAEDEMAPIIGYCPEGQFDSQTLPPALTAWLARVGSAVIAAGNAVSKSQPHPAWANLLEEEASTAVSKSSSASISGPLLATSWGQGEGYNTDIPDLAPTGCVATAMAQIMKYWEYPSKGNDIVHCIISNTVCTDPPRYFPEDPVYTDHCVDFNTNYDYSDMPLSSGSPETALLMYHAGVAVNMHYTPDESSACMNHAEYAFWNYFGYDAWHVNRSRYDDADWHSLMAAEIQAGRPILYGGQDQDIAAGHTWVVDGYDDSSDLFHVNWGWNGSCNMWLDLDLIQVDTATGLKDYTDDQHAVIHIEPSGRSFKFKFQAGSGIFSSPAIAGASLENPAQWRIYAGTRDGRMLAVDGIGRAVWEFDTAENGDADAGAGSVLSSPAIAPDGTIYFASECNAYDEYTDKCIKSYIYALNPDGSLKWAYPTEGETTSSPAVGFGGNVYIGSTDGYLYAVKPDGTLKWRFAAGAGIESSPAIAPDGTIYFGADTDTNGEKATLFALDQNGEELWRDTPRMGTTSVTDTALMFGPAIAEDGTIYFGSMKFLHAYEPGGIRKWGYGDWTSLMFSTMSPVIGPDGTVYVGGNSSYRHLYAIDPDPADPENVSPKWSFDADCGIRSAPAIRQDGSLVFGADDGNIFTLDSNGDLLWSLSTGSTGCHSSPVITPDGTILIGCEDGNLYAVRDDDTDENGLSQSSWPMFRADTRRSGNLGGCFGQQVLLSVDSTGNGSVIAPGEGEFTYGCGTEITLKAVPAKGDYFVRWFGDVTTLNDPASPETSMVIMEDAFIRAEFAPLQVIYVDAGATGSGDGTSWADAYPILQNAIFEAGSLASQGAMVQVWVKKGTYYSSFFTSSDTRSATLMLANKAAVYGGFSGNEDPSSFSLDQRDISTNETILSGQPFSSYHVVTASGVDEFTILNGFTITGGNQSGAPVTDAYGAGLYASQSSLKVSNCRFENNVAFIFGGGMYASGGKPVITSCVFENNRATGGGGGLYNSQHSGRVINSVFFGNQASTGGGILNSGSSVRVINCTLSENSGNGGGMAFVSNDASHVTNTIVWGNTASSPAYYEVYADSSSSSNVYFYYNYLGMCNEDGEQQVDDPRFADAGAGDFHLQPGSPCIDKGDHGNILSYVQTDMDGEPRISDGALDWGADEMLPLPPGKAVCFSGTGDPFATEYAELGHIDPGDSFTAELWVNPAQEKDGQCFIGKHTASGGNIFLLGFWSGGVHVRIKDQYYTAGSQFTGWHHLAVTVEAQDQNSRVTVYRDGEPLWSQLLASAIDSFTGLPWVLGMDWDGTTRTDFFNGQIDEVRIWNRVRTPEEIKLWYSKIMLGSTQGLEAYFRFDHNKGMTLYDQTGSGYGGLFYLYGYWPTPLPPYTPELGWLPITPILDDSLALLDGTPVVSTASMGDLSCISASSGGTVLPGAVAPVTGRGVCWNIAGSPTTADACTLDGAGDGDYTSSLTGLSPETDYYVRAYAQNAYGVDYGPQISFTTSSALPQVGITPVTDITYNSASAGGYVQDDLGLPVLDQGLCWNTDGSPDAEDTCSSAGTGTGEFFVDMTGLSPQTTYYVRAYAANTHGSGYSSQISFSTAVVLPMVETKPVTGITDISAVSGGNVTDDSGYEVTARGVCWNSSGSPTLADTCTSDGSGIGEFTSRLEGLNPMMTYYVRAYASNEYETAYGAQRTFATPAEVTEAWVDTGLACSGQTPCFATIQEGINALAAGGSVSVAPGVYHENIVLADGVQLIGAGACDDPSSCAIISGDIDGDGDGDGPVIMAVGVGDTTLVKGFTLTQGTGLDGSYGGGMYVSASFLTVEDCIFKGNEATLGGGMYNSYASSPKINGCRFEDNSATVYGGGMYNDFYASPMILDTVFLRNHAQASGGGMYNTSFSSPVLDRNRFINNSAMMSGGGMANLGAFPVITNTVFSGNTALNPDNTGTGGGMVCYATLLRLVNATFHGNRADLGSGLACDTTGETDPSRVEAANSIFWDTPETGGSILNRDSSVLEVTFSDVYMDAQVFPGSGNINEDPLFAAPGYWDDNASPENPTDVTWITGDYHLLAASPCVDAASNSVPGLPVSDFEGDFRVMDGDGDTFPVADMGADELSGGGTAPPETVMVDDDWIGTAPGVDPDGDGPAGRFGVDAFAGIQEAMGVVASPGTVVVLEGHFQENLFLKPGVMIRGEGFDKTLIDGGGNGPVITAQGVDGTAGISGCFIFNGSSLEGGGIHLKNASPTVRDTIVFNNQADYGGGIFCLNSSPCLVNCQVIGNRAVQQGGGLYHLAFAGNCLPLLLNTTITGNRAGLNGGAMFSEVSAWGQCGPKVVNSILWGNVPDEIAGDEDDPKALPDVTFSDISGGYGTLDDHNIDADPLFRNMPEIWDETASSSDSPDVIRVADGTLYSQGDFIEIDNDGVSRTVTGVSDNLITFAPPLTAPAREGCLIENWAGNGTNLLENPDLSVDSPCIDQGDNLAAMLPEKDYRDRPRIMDGDGDGISVVDMGVAEINPDTCPGDNDLDSDVDGSDLAAHAQSPDPALLEDLAANFGKTDCP